MEIYTKKTYNPLLKTIINTKNQLNFDKKDLFQRRMFLTSYNCLNDLFL